MTVSARLGWLLPPKILWALRRHRASRRRSIAQIGQDFWVAGEVFNEMKGGYFVDVGAADGYTISNTYLLESRYDWSGICIEANPDFMARLTACRRAICVNACLDSAPGNVTFTKNGLFGGIVNADLQQPSAPAEQISVRTKTLLEVLELTSAPREVDYLSADIEGAEERVLSGFDFGKYTFRCMTIERPSVRLRQLLADSDYELVKNMPGLDAFYVHRSFLDQYARNAMAFWSKHI